MNNKECEIDTNTELRTFNVPRENYKSYLKDFMDNQHKTGFKFHFSINNGNGANASMHGDKMGITDKGKYLVVSENSDASALFDLKNIVSIWFTNRRPDFFYISI